MSERTGRRSRRLVIILLLLAAVAWARSEGPAAHSQESASIYVDPETQEVDLDAGTFEVRVMIDDVTAAPGLGGYTLVMTYDPAVLEAQSVVDSGFVASTNNAVICPSMAIDNDTGELASVCFTISILGETGPQTTEPQVLARITFEPVGGGRSALAIGGTTIIDPQGSTLAAEAIDGSVTVLTGSPVPTPGETPTLAVTAVAAEEDEGDDGNALLLIAIGVGTAAALAAAAGAVVLARRRRAS